MDADVMPAAGSLPGDLECEVAIIGSGIAGLSTAYLSSADGANRWPSSIEVQSPAA